MWKLLDANQPEDKLLRVVTLLANIVCSGRGDNAATPLAPSGAATAAAAAAVHNDKQAEPFLNGASLLLSHPYVYVTF